MYSRSFRLLSLLVVVFLCVAWAGAADANPTNRVVYNLDSNASGVTETINNIVNLTVVSTDANDLKAEYRAGFVQGKLQGTTILSARDNAWDMLYLLDPSHSFPKQRGPAPAELNQAAGILNSNYDAFIQYLHNPATDAEVSHRFERLLFRMLGIYHGATLAQPASLDFSGSWLPDNAYLKPEELALGYEMTGLTFMDVYFVSAYADLMDVISSSMTPALVGARATDHPDSCSAFLKRTGQEVLLTHNTWQGFLSQTMVMTLSINGEWFTVNSSAPGTLSSGTDFGYNNKGILFNETTHRMSKVTVKPDGIWTFWRAALAEQFSGSLDDFFRYISLDNTGTYLNGYMLVDAKTNETGLVEMSYRCFVYYRSNGGPYSVTSKSLDGAPCATDYDAEMITPDYLMGINFPASLQVRDDLQSTDNRPARREQFKQLLPGVTNTDDAKAVITHTDPANPLSIFGRWDLGYGQTNYPKQIVDGSIDAKVADTAMVRSFMGLDGAFDLTSPASGFWMKFGTPYVDGSPFIWSLSSWKWQKLRDVPDRLDGAFTLMPLYLR